MKSFAGKGAGDGAVGADEPEIEAELLGDRKGKGMAATGDENDFDTGGVSAAESFEIIWRDLKLGIEKGAVDIGGEKADGSGLRAAGLRRRQGTRGFYHVSLLHKLGYTGWVIRAFELRSNGTVPPTLPRVGLGGCPYRKGLGFFSFIESGGKVHQVVRGDVLGIMDNCADSGAKFGDRIFQLFSFRDGEQGTQLADALFGGNWHSGEHGRKLAKILYRVSRRGLRCPS